MGSEEDAQRCHLDDIESINHAGVDVVQTKGPPNEPDPGVYYAIGAYKHEIGRRHLVTLIPLVLEDEQTKSDLITDLKIGELFCGAGGSSCGFSKHGFRPLFGVEKNKDAAATFLVCYICFVHS